MILVDLCCGTASVGLACLTHPRRPPPPPTGFMGSKRRWARLLASALVGDATVERLVLVDAGPWGDVWETLSTREGRVSVVERLLVLDTAPLDELWPRLVEVPPHETNAGIRVAQYLCLQARSAGTIPIWWSPERARWESPTGSRTEAAHEGRPGMAARRRMKTLGPPILGQRPTSRSRGLVRVRTLATRAAALETLPWDRIEVRRALVQHVDPIPGATVYFDPPYAHSPRYAVTLGRDQVLDVARRWANAGARVAVSEAERLPLEGWDAWPLPAAQKSEVVTTWGVPRPARLIQGQLFSAAS